MTPDSVVVLVLVFCIMWFTRTLTSNREDLTDEELEELGEVDSWEQ